MFGPKHEAGLLLKQAGWTDERIGLALSVSTNGILKWRTRHGIQATTTYKIDVAKALELYNSGASDCEIARVFGVTQSGATRWRQRRGLPPNIERAPVLTDSEKRKAKSLLRARASRRQVALALGRSLETVARIRKGMRPQVGLRRSGESVKNARQRVAKQFSPERLLRRIQRAVGSRVPPDIAADATNDLYVAILEDRVKPEQIETEAPKFVRRILGEFASRYRTVSIDLRDESGFCLADRLVDEQAQNEIVRNAERAFALP
jgi:transposase-like protein